MTLESSGLPGLSSTTIYATPACPTIAPSNGRYADAVDLDLPPSATRSVVVECQPYTAFHMHHTDSIDFDIVLTGTAELGLDDGVHVLQAGDCVVVTGVDHAWRAGPDGCRLSVTSVGASDLVRRRVRGQSLKRLFGLPAGEAREICQRPLPDIEGLNLPDSAD